MEGAGSDLKGEPAAAGYGEEFAIYPSWNARAVGLDLQAHDAIVVAARPGSKASISWCATLSIRASMSASFAGGWTILAYAAAPGHCR